ELFPMSSKASADRASTKQTARQISSTFFMTLYSPLEFRLRPHTAGIMEQQDRNRLRRRSPCVVVKVTRRNYITGKLGSCRRQ
ncbi:MAG TPA: hypothetical protein VMG82_14395, partial [Candidatus Sulfotelmatobacter sp.]|nr:hypothetical protein [Candidatus Sulfotelmatobacter sp.]